MVTPLLDANQGDEDDCDTDYDAGDRDSGNCTGRQFAAVVVADDVNIDVTFDREVWELAGSCVNDMTASRFSIYGHGLDVFHAAPFLSYRKFTVGTKFQRNVFCDLCAAGAI